MPCRDRISDCNLWLDSRKPVVNTFLGKKKSFNVCICFECPGNQNSDAWFYFYIWLDISQLVYIAHIASKLKDVHSVVWPKPSGYSSKASSDNPKFLTFQLIDTRPLNKVIIKPSMLSIKHITSIGNLNPVQASASKWFCILVKNCSLSDKRPVLSPYLHVCLRRCLPVLLCLCLYLSFSLSVCSPFVLGILLLRQQDPSLSSLSSS